MTFVSVDRGQTLPINGALLFTMAGCGDGVCLLAWVLVEPSTMMGRLRTSCAEAADSSLRVRGEVPRIFRHTSAVAGSPDSLFLHDSVLFVKDEMSEGPWGRGYAEARIRAAGTGGRSV